MRLLTSPFLAAFAFCAFTLLSWSASWAPAHAQAGHIRGSVRVDAHLGVGWHGNLGPGLRLDIPLSRDGLIPSANDELALTLGADFLFHAYDHDLHHGHHRHHSDHRHHGDLTLLFPIAVQWNFILSSRWTIFPELGLAIEHHNEHVHLLLDIAAGARCLLGSGRAALLLRVTHPGGFQVGITW